MNFAAFGVRSIRHQNFRMHAALFLVVEHLLSRMFRNWMGLSVYTHCRQGVRGHALILVIGTTPLHFDFLATREQWPEQTQLVYRPRERHRTLLREYAVPPIAHVWS